MLVSMDDFTSQLQTTETETLTSERVNNYTEDHSFDVGSEECSKIVPPKNLDPEELENIEFCRRNITLFK